MPARTNLFPMTPTNPTPPATVAVPAVKTNNPPAKTEESAHLFQGGCIFKYASNNLKAIFLSFGGRLPTFNPLRKACSWTMILVKILSCLYLFSSSSCSSAVLPDFSNLAFSVAYIWFPYCTAIWSYSSSSFFNSGGTSESSTFCPLINLIARVIFPVFFFLSAKNSLYALAYLVLASSSFVCTAISSGVVHFGSKLTTPFAFSGPPLFGVGGIAPTTPVPFLALASAIAASLIRFCSSEVVPGTDVPLFSFSFM